MVKNIRLLIIFMITAIILFIAGMAVQRNLDENNKSPQKPGVIANRFLDQLQKAYETKNIPLLVSLYKNPTVAVDATRKENKLYTPSKLQKEIKKTFNGLTGIQCNFTGRQITAEGDTIIISATRSVTANEIPIIANCFMVMVLRKSFIRGQSWNYVVTDQTLLKEEYIPKSTSGNTKNDRK